MSDDKARKRKNARGHERRWGKNRVVLTISVPEDTHTEYKAKCARRGLSMNRVGNELVRSFLDEEEDT